MGSNETSHMPYCPLKLVASTSVAMLKLIVKKTYKIYFQHFAIYTISFKLNSFLENMYRSPSYSKLYMSGIVFGVI